MKYAYQIEQWTGRLEWGDKYFGGTNNYIKIVGLVFVIISLLYLFGAFQLIVSPLGQFFGTGE